MRGIPLGFLLDHPLLAGFRVLAGTDGLEREVLWLSVVRSPYELPPDEQTESILLAPEAAWRTGFDPGAPSKLARRGVAAFFTVRETQSEPGKSALSGFPQGLLESCESLGLPAVALYPGTGYREASRALAGLLVSINAGAGVSKDSELSRTLDGISRVEGLRLEVLCFPPGLRELREWPEIRESLRSYLLHRGNAMAAAAELGVHRHTIRSRVRRYQGLSGLDLDNPEHRPLVELAFLLAARRAGGPGQETTLP